MHETLNHLIDWLETAIDLIPVPDEIDVGITEAELQADLNFGRGDEVEEPAEPVLH
ncbi:MAG: hypothetical protein V3T05_11505 [Myxococcota bacterium]